MEKQNNFTRLLELLCGIDIDYAIDVQTIIYQQVV